MDNIDKKILEALAKDGRMAITELAENIGLSPTPCKKRVSRLEKAGYILGYSAIINVEKLNLSHIAFVEVTLERTDDITLKAFNLSVQKVPEIEQCHMIAGSFDYLLKIRTRDIKEYRRILGEVISNLPHVQSTSTNVSMESVKEGRGHRH